MNEYMSAEEFYDGFEDHLRKLYAGGWSPESVPGRNAQEEFTKWLNHLRAQAWDEGQEAEAEAQFQDAGYGNVQHPENPYRSTE